MKNTVFTFHTAKQNDLNQILEIWVQGVSIIYPDMIIKDDMINIFKSNFQKRKFPYNFWLAKFHDEVVGWVSVLQAFSNPLKQFNEAEISIYVKPQYKNNKVGKELTEYVFEQLTPSKIKNVWAFVANHNHNSKKMCENSGMNVCGQTSTKIILLKEL